MSDSSKQPFGESACDAPLTASDLFDVLVSLLREGRSGGSLVQARLLQSSQNDGQHLVALAMETTMDWMSSKCTALRDSTSPSLFGVTKVPKLILYA